MEAKLLHKAITETSFSRVSASRLLRGGWEDHVFRWMCVAGAEDWGLGWGPSGRSSLSPGWSTGQCQIVTDP